MTEGEICECLWNLWPEETSYYGEENSVEEDVHEVGGAEFEEEDVGLLFVLFPSFFEFVGSGVFEVNVECK